MGSNSADSMQEPLRLLIDVLNLAGTPYALIGGLAIQLHSDEPRTTLDIDIAVPTFADVPAVALAAAGFEHDEQHTHSDNWRAPGSGPRRHRVAVQFSAEDVGIGAAVANATKWQVDQLSIRVARPAELLVLKLAAAEEPTRRMRKRRQDLLDILNLTEDFAEAAQQLPELAVRVAALKRELLG